MNIILLSNIILSLSDIFTILARCSKASASELLYVGKLEIKEYHIPRLF